MTISFGINLRTLREKKNLSEKVFMDCKESGSTLRFFIPIVLAMGLECEFTGHGRLMERPLEPYFKIFREKGIDYTLKDNKLTVSGKLESGKYMAEKLFSITDDFTAIVTTNDLMAYGVIDEIVKPKKNV